VPQSDRVRIDNPSRERILERIRAGLRTAIPEPVTTGPDRVIFEPVVNPLERFQQECVANLMECTLTADSAASARQLSQVLQSLPEDFRADLQFAGRAGARPRRLRRRRLR